MAGPWEAFQSGEPAQGPWNAFVQLPTPEPTKTAELKSDVGRGAALGRGTAQGATFGFSDELLGAYSASGIPELLENLKGEDRSAAVRILAGALEKPAKLAAPAIGAVRLGYEALTGKGEAMPRYEEIRDKEREANKAAQEQHPGTYLTGQVAGSLAVPLPGVAVARGATLGGRVLGGAVTGAGIGGLTGVGEGEGLADSAVRGATGAAIGSVIGGAAAPVIEGATRLGSAVASYPVNLVRAAMNPTGAAERAVGRAGMEATRVDPNAVNRLTPQEVAPGGPGVAMDVLGQPGRNLARSAGNLSGEARDVLNQTLDPRFEQQVPRLIGWLRQGMHYPDAHAQQEALEQTQRAVNARSYGIARQAGDRQLWSDELERLTGAPEVAEAMRNAATKGKGRAILEGGGGFNPGVTVDNGGIVTFQRGPSGVPTYPNLQFWDFARRELSGAADKANRAGSTEEASRLGGLARLMNTELDRLVPSYQQARQGAAQFFGAENALEAGQRFVTENFAIPQTRAAIARMAPAERQLFQDGFVSRYMEMLSNIPDRADVVRRIYHNDTARQKIEIALGPQRARELEAMLRVENIMQQGLRAVQGNSTTAMQILGAGLAGAGGGGFLGFDPSTSGLAAALATAGKRGIDQRVAVRIAELLTSRDPQVLQRGARMIASNGRLMDALRIADNSAARIGGQQSTNFPALQAGGVGRADEDQQQVPRMPGQ